MLGLIYLLNCIFLGFAIISDIFQWNGSRELYTFKKKKKITRLAKRLVDHKKPELEEVSHEEDIQRAYDK